MQQQQRALFFRVRDATSAEEDRAKVGLFLSGVQTLQGGTKRAKGFAGGKGRVDEARSSTLSLEQGLGGPLKRRASRNRTCCTFFSDDDGCPFSRSRSLRLCLSVPRFVEQEIDRIVCFAFFLCCL